MILTARNTSRRIATLTATVLLVVACSGSDNAIPSTTRSAVAPPSPTDASIATTSTTTTTTTIESAPTTTEPLPVVDTEPPTEPPPETSEPPATITPTNTIFDPATLEGEVEQAALANLIAFRECLGQLPTCDVESATRFASLEYADGNTRLLSEWISAGYISRDIDDYNFRVDSVEVFEEVAEALVEVCVWGGTQLLLPATTDTPEQIIDGEYSSSRQRYLVRRLGSSWLVTANDSLESVVGVENNICV